MWTLSVTCTTVREPSSRMSKRWSWLPYPHWNQLVYKPGVHHDGNVLNDSSFFPVSTLLPWCTIRTLSSFAVKVLVRYGTCLPSKVFKLGLGNCSLQLNNVLLISRVMTCGWTKVAAECSSLLPLVCVVRWVITALRLSSLILPSIRPSLCFCIDVQRKSTSFPWISSLECSLMVLLTVKCTRWWKLLSRRENKIKADK